jgi:hypothetical protein
MAAAHSPVEDLQLLLLRLMLDASVSVVCRFWEA